MECPKCKKENEDNKMFGICNDCLDVFIDNIIHPKQPEMKNYICQDCNKKFQMIPGTKRNCPECGSFNI